jgi:hypothetical protein
MLGNALKSRTVLFGLLLTVASIAQMLVPFFPPQYVGIAGTAIGIAVIVLRFVTSLPLDQK